MGIWCTNGFIRSIDDEKDDQGCDYHFIIPMKIRDYSDVSDNHFPYS